MKLFYILQILLLLLLFSCNEESVTEVKKDIEEEEELHIQELEIKYTLYPEYTFWNSKFRITIEKDTIFDSLNFSFKFNNLELEPIDTLVDSTVLNFIFKTPLNSFSDSLEITCFSKKDTIKKFTRKFDVVNSEIKLDPIQNHILCDNNFILKGNGLKYAKHINIYQRKIDIVSDHLYNGASPNSCETIDDNTAKFKINHQYAFYLSIVDYDSLYTDEFPDIIKNESDRIFQIYRVVNIENPKINTAKLENNQVILTTSKWAKLKENDKIYFDNKLIPNSEITFYPAIIREFELNGYDRVYYYSDSEGIVTFNLPDNCKTNDLRIEFECGGEIKLTPEIGNQFKFVNVKIIDVKVNYIINEGNDYFKSRLKDFNFEFDSLQSNIHFPLKYVSFDPNTKSINKDMSMSSMQIKEINQNNINFEFYWKDESGTAPGNSQTIYTQILKMNYSGNYQFFEDSKYIYITIPKEKLNDIYFDYVESIWRTGSYLLYAKLGSAEFNDNSSIEMTLEKW